jgi:tRNA wybutosine-synthesizing protein 2
MSEDDTALAAVVEKPRAQTAIAALREEGVYDDDRSIREVGGDTVAIPVTDPPRKTDVLEVIRETGEPRLRDLPDHLRQRGWTDEEVAQAPSSWAVIGSVILVNVADTPRPGEVGDALLAMHGGADTVLAREGISGPHREPEVRVIAGEGDTETVHREHGTEYALDLTAVMFSPGNKAERKRMGEVVRGGESGEPAERADGATASGDAERVLDMFAGIGYFTLPMARAGAHVTAIERNPDAFQYLLENAMRNGVADRIEPYRADCRDVTDAHDGTPFERVVMGYYEAHEYLQHALPVLESGGWLHMHEATPEALVPERPVERLRTAADERGRTIDVCDTRKIKGYSEGVAHVVVDARVE